MNKRGHLLVLGVLLLAFHSVLCSEFARKYALSKLALSNENSNDDVFKSFWRNSKRRRSVQSMGIRQYKLAQPTQTNKPQHECGDRVLTVVLKYADTGNIRIYGPHGNKLNLEQLAEFCGVSVKTTNTDFRLLFNYDGCYVKQEVSKRVLSLSWYGKDLDLTCPVSVTPPSVICKDKAMALTVVDGIADQVSVALNGEWAPLLYVATQCWQRERSNQGVLTFSIPHKSCGVTVGEGNFELDLRLNDQTTTLSCPYEQTSLLPVEDSNIYHKPPTGFPKATASPIVKKQVVLVEQPATNEARPPFLHRRSPSLPKLPPLPGSFNLAVNFPFSIPMPSRHAHIDYLASKPAAVIPEPTPALTPDPTDLSAEFSSSDENQQSPVSYEQKEEETTAPVTQAPKSEYQYPKYLEFEKPAPTSTQIKPPPSDQEYLLSGGQLYRPDSPAHNFPKRNPQLNPAFANLAQYIPPGYFLCSYNGQQPPIYPHMFPPSVPNQPLQYQKPSYQKPDIAPLVPVNPLVPPMKGYLLQQQQLPTGAVASSTHDSGTPLVPVNPLVPPMKGYLLQQQQLPTGAVASSAHDSGTPLFQRTQYFQTSPYQQLYPSGYGSEASTTSLSPTSHLTPINLQSQIRPYPPFQDSRPLQPQYQKPSQPLGSVQQPWSTSSLIVNRLTQESRPFLSASSQTPPYLQYQTSGGQSLDPYRSSVLTAPVTGLSSPLQYMPSQLPTLSYSLRPEKLSADVFTENTGSSPQGFVQPRSRSSVLLPRAQLPHRQGPSVRYMQSLHAHPERPDEPRSQASA